MTALYIIIGILVLLFAIAFINVNLIFSYEDKFDVKLRILFVKINILKLFEKEKKPKKQKKKTAQDASDNKTKKKGTFEDFKSFLELIISCIRMFTDNLSRSLKVHIKRLEVKVASDSADKTAMMYGTIANTVSILLELLPNTVRAFKHDYKNINIFPDYLAEKCSFSAEIVFTMKIWHLLRILFGAIRVFGENTRKRISERNRAKL